MLSELLSMQLAFLLLFVYNRGVIKQQSGDGVGGMCDHAETIHLNVNSPVPFCCLRLREKDGKEIVRRKKFDRILQGGFLLTGILIRWCYLIFFYLPGLK